MFSIKKESDLSFLLVLILCLLLAIVADTAAYHLLGNDSFNIAGNFSAISASLFFGYIRVSFLDWRRVVAATTIFFLGLMGLVTVGLFLFDYSIMLGLMLTLPVGAIGYYPRSPDAPAMDIIPVWSLSAVLPLLVGYSIGARLRKQQLR